MAKANRKFRKSSFIWAFGHKFNYHPRPKQIRQAVQQKKDRIRAEHKVINLIRFNRVGKKGRYW